MLCLQGSSLESLTSKRREPIQGGANSDKDEPDQDVQLPGAANWDNYNHGC